MEKEIVNEEVFEVEDEVVETESETEEVETTGEVIDWEARAKKAEALIVKNKKEPKAKEKEVINPDTDLKDTVERQGLQLDGYAPEVVEQIMELGGKAALANPVLKKAADELQAEHAAVKAADIGEGSQGQTKTKYSNEDLAAMSSEEMEKVLPHAN